MTPARARHSKPDVEKALQHAEANGWQVSVSSGGHAWGQARCKTAGCRVSIWSTPKNAGNHAKQIRRAVKNCPH